jgi:hypothetical protein
VFAPVTAAASLAGVAKENSKSLAGMTGVFVSASTRPTWRSFGTPTRSSSKPMKSCVRPAGESALVAKSVDAVVKAVAAAVSSAWMSARMSEKSSARAVGATAAEIVAAAAQ